MYRITIYDEEYVIKGDEVKKVTTERKYNCPTVEAFEQFVAMLVMFSEKELKCTIGKVEEGTND